ncbi:hypothetical protein H9X96_05845 [Pedobacter sp. N36a]|uniref:hypothetical protein n=1 Tax=Pedobacter sp. N36a TaxID=2767996 RepID=UPI0016570167|nr:hypothetical protein [Pedobacter sp. N36a]MBC8985292.1 hypothetical protein [Pedobacter sp. N36a]
MFQHYPLRLNSNGLYGYRNGKQNMIRFPNEKLQEREGITITVLDLERLAKMKN